MAFEAAYTVIVKLAGRLVSRPQYNEIVTEVARNIAAIIFDSSGMPDGRESAHLNGAAVKKPNKFASQLHYPGFVTEIARDVVRYVLSNRLASQPFPEIALVHDYTVGVAAGARDQSSLQDMRGRVVEVLQRLHDHVALRMVNGLPFVEAYNEAAAAAIGSILAAGAKKAAEGRGLMPEIASRVLAEVIPWTVQKATAPRILIRIR